MAPPQPNKAANLLPLRAEQVQQGVESLPDDRGYITEDVHLGNPLLSKSLRQPQGKAISSASREVQRPAAEAWLETACPALTRV